CGCVLCAGGWGGGGGVLDCTWMLCLRLCSLFLLENLIVARAVRGVRGKTEIHSEGASPPCPLSWFPSQVLGCSSCLEREGQPWSRSRLESYESCPTIQHNQAVFTSCIWSSAAPYTCTYTHTHTHTQIQIQSQK